MWDYAIEATIVTAAALCYLPSADQYFKGRVDRRSIENEHDKSSSEV